MFKLKIKYLEPDKLNKYGFLNAIRKALEDENEM